ncbi:hypothetical protein [Leptospira borgpetersenii]|uniref:Uncharacterized protein n=1 Tax=Leptospira borgpetersenii serovar Ballum TaxID=280505 RepID=A0A0E3B3Y3_LEPBO|nr:hypothetical protein [Leptospira borgpetersenii]EMO09145.1 hypothetical protein LEP1GSC137_2734 [Leptospira borgpetersenii str. Noumea 25]MBF3372490.1 hypothetical protein [Leptospira borgpetersenii serovar Arborea]ALO27576.1 hypothetical protein LBBP_03382 [Leptospira borgpetersenii serovar Ballum]ANH01868.1 Uncharacterized protein LB4E_2652 [Leptospira borgpetersenii str. 4E]EKQ99767.1 hypothetical protein LEP1GSC121_1926 [Leptospira borgpetersenii serovar Castellonis str. 200801910]
MNWVEETLLYFFIIYAVFQFLVSGPVLQLLINFFSFRHFKFRWFSSGVILPILYVVSRNCRIEFPGILKTDQVYARVSSLNLKIEFFPLFRGKLKISSSIFKNFHMDYTNIISSYKKMGLMPKRGKIVFQNMRMENGSISIVDKTLTPTYAIQLHDIAIEGGYMDFGSPLEVLFRTKSGTCRLGKRGSLKIGVLEGETRGFLSLSDITWSELAGLQVISLPFLKNRVQIYVEFKHINLDETILEGTLIHFAPHSQDKPEQSYPFHFTIVWQNYNLPFDLALRELVLELFLKIKLKGVMTRMLQTVAKGLYMIIGKNRSYKHDSL